MDEIKQKPPIEFPWIFTDPNDNIAASTIDEFIITANPILTGLGTWNNSPNNTKPVIFSNDVEYKGNVTIDGRNLNEVLKGIEKRLSILVPDLKKLEKYEALKKAYEHYKTLERLISEGDLEEPK
jgi:hypothetical protein